MKLIRKIGATSEIWQIFIASSASTTGAGLTGLVFNTASLTAYYHRDTDTTATAIALVTMTSGTFTSSGFKEIDATNMPGWYQFCPPNAALASGARSCAFHLQGASNMAPLPIEVDLDAQVDVTSWNGTAVSSPATAGVPDVNVKNINNVATTSVTSVAANLGHAQPINFTGTGGTALVKSDMIDIAGQTVTAGAGVTFPSSIASPTNITAGTITTVTSLTNAPTAGDFTATMKTSLNNSTPASITGAVGSVTGNVGGNVVGSVGSVTAGVTVTTNNDKTGYALSAAGNAALTTTTMTEAYSTKGSAFTLAQGIYDMHQLMLEQKIAGTTLTAKKRDQTTTAKTGTLDSSTAPTSITEAS